MKEKIEEVFFSLKKAIIDMDERAMVYWANKVIEEDVDVHKAIEEGLSPAMEYLGGEFEKGNIFIPELLVSADVFKKGFEILGNALKFEKKIKGKGVIGVIEGDTHDIGKNIVKIIMESVGIEMIDLGRDVQVERFVEDAIRNNAELICISCLMTTCMPNIKKVLDYLIEKGVRNKFKVLIGGRPLSLSFAKRIGADAYGKNALDGMKIAEKFLSKSL